MTVPHPPGPVTEAPSDCPLCLDFDFRVADECIQDSISHGHPFPNRSITDLGIDFDFVSQDARLTIKDFA